MTTPLIESTTAGGESPVPKVLEQLWNEATEEQNRLRPKQAASDSESHAQDDQEPRPSRATTIRVRFAHD